MLKLADRVKEATITQGSGLYIVLNGAAQAFQTFANTIGLVNKYSLAPK